LSPPPTQLGDLIRVVHALRPDPEELALIRELLNDDGSAAAGAMGGPGAALDDDEPVGRAEPLGRSRRETTAPPNLRPARAAPARRRPSFLSAQARWERAWWTTVVALVVLLLGLRVTGRIGGVAWLVLAVVLVVIRPVLSSYAMWWRSARRYSVAERDGDRATASDELEMVPLDRARWRPPPEGAPLGRPGQQRAVATLLAGRSVPGEVDLATMVGKIASRQPLTSVPRHRRWSTNLGVQLQVDRRAALEPFRGDIVRLRRALAAVASQQALDEVGFEGDPRRITWPRRLLGGAPSIRIEARLPAPGTPVLVVTDLGIAVPRTGPVGGPAPFLEHYEVLSQAGADVHYLVPYPPDRWPPMLAGLPLVYWSDHLGASQVLARIRRRRHG
jgi:hypothetical protein